MIVACDQGEKVHVKGFDSKLNRGSNQIEMDWACSQSEYSFCSLSSANGRLHDSDSRLKLGSAGSGRLLDEAADRLLGAVLLTSMVTVCC